MSRGRGPERNAMAVAARFVNSKHVHAVVAAALRKGLGRP